MKKRILITLIILLVVFGGIFTWDAIRHYGMKQYFAHMQLPPVTVSAEQAKASTWHPTLSAVGSLTAVNGVNVSAEVPGIVSQIYFTSGQKVNRGDLLVQLRDAVDQATLKNSQAALALAKVQYHRAQLMYQKHLIAKAAMDETTAKYQEAQAMAEQTQQTINQKHIRAPFSGRIGIRKVNLGQYLSSGNAIATLQALDPLYVNFSLPEQYLSRLVINEEIDVTTESYPKEIFKGKISAINSKVDEDTRSIAIQGIIQNTKHLLYPGNFAQVTVVLPQQQNIIVVPQTAIAYSLYGDTIYVLTKTNRTQNGKPIYIANQHFVKVGDQRGDQAQILSGIKAGDLIVTTGQIKLNDKSPVIINNNIKLK